MRKISPEKIAPICFNCGTPMKLNIYSNDWNCPNRFHCGSRPIRYIEQKKIVEKNQSKII